MSSSNLVFLPGNEVDSLVHGAISAGRIRATQCVGLTHEQWLKLASDPMWAVREAVARNPLCPADILRRMFFDEEETNVSVLRGLMRNPSTPVEILREMYRLVEVYESDIDLSNPPGYYDCPYDYMGVFGNPNLGESAVNSLASAALQSKETQNKFLGILRNPLLSVEYMRMVIERQKRDEVLSLAMNPALPCDVLEQVLDLVPEHVSDLRVELVQRLLDAGVEFLEGWPVEWVENHYQVKLTREG